MDKKKRSRAYNRPLIIVLIIGILYVVYQFISLEISYHKLVAQRDRLAEELAEKKVYYENLQHTVGNAQSDQYIEELAKKYLGLIKADEKILILRQPQEPQE